MKLLYYINKSRGLPVRIVIVKTGNLLLRTIKNKFYHLCDRLFSTFNSKNLRLETMGFSIFEEFDAAAKKRIINLANLYCNHYFDLLGSGWTKVYYSMRVRGIEGYCYKQDKQILHDKQKDWMKDRLNRSNFKKVCKIWQLVDANYNPIDWQLDFKSGYRWSEKIWYKHIQYGHKLGVDIKVPWELARMQHLPMLALAFRLDTKCRKKYTREFCNQLLDFIANNPPRFGVNWRCTMDVGIRVSNWLIAYDLFKQSGANFDKTFEHIFAQSVYEHGLHIIHNLEYTPELRSNHYLSNVAGLLMVAAHLPCSEVVNRWLAFSVQELISEMGHEFNTDGSNFEASTSYHRLSTEIMLYCAIVCLGLPEEKKKALISYSPKDHHVQPKLKELSEQMYNIDSWQMLPDWFWERLEKACEFTKHIMKSDGNIPQIGDNDSGRFLKLWSSYITMTVVQAVSKYKNLKDYKELPESSAYYDENILDHRHILAVAGILFDRQDFLKAAGRERMIEGHMIENLLGKRRIKSYRYNHHKTEYAARVITGRSIEDLQRQLEKKYGEPTITCFKKKEEDLIDGLEIFSYSEFGLYIYKSGQLYLAVRCGNIGQYGNGGHAHNDQLSIELNIGGRDIICDPGTYCYTPFPELRNQFRSTQYHFTPQFKNQEQNQWLPGKNGLFSLVSDRSHATCLYFAEDGFIGYHTGFISEVYRVIRLNPESLAILDFNCQSVYEPIHISSNGYGKLLNEGYW